LGECLLLIAYAVASFGLVVGLAFIEGGLLSGASVEIQRNAPHLDNILGSYAYQMAMYFNLQHLACENETCWTNATKNRTERIDAAYAKMEQVRYFWNLARFGGPAVEETPFARFEEVLAGEQSIVRDQCTQPIRLFQ
jgi:hypothetical protein